MLCNIMSLLISMCTEKKKNLMLQTTISSSDIEYSEAHIYEEFNVVDCKTEVEIDSACVTNSVSFF